jgi:phytoene dehydrogenase-like protein
LDVTLCEAHSRLGGCAGWFDRGPYVFDAGATALMGLGRDEPMGELLASIGLDFEAEPTARYRVCLPDRDVSIVPDPCAFEAEIAARFPGRDSSRRRFWRLQAWVGTRLLAAAGNGPRLPLRTPSDLIHDARVLGLDGIAAASTSLVTVADVLRLMGLANDTPFVSLIAMLLQDTAQAGPEFVPFANAAACLQAYRLGMRRPRGGMRALAEGIGERFACLGGELRTTTLVDRVEPDPDRAEGYVVVTRRRERIRARHVAFNMPIDRAAFLLDRSLEGRLARCESRSRAAWSAFTGYLVMRDEAVPDDGTLFHQVLRDYDAPIHDGNNVLISLSPPGDLGYGPEGVRVATLSTHVRPADWVGLDKQAYRDRKNSYSSRLMAALGRALPDAPQALVHAEFGTPLSFQRYTRRRDGAVGGPPVRRTNSNFLAVGSDVLGGNLWLVGDSVFPGQGTLAVVIGARRVLERILEKSKTASTHARYPEPLATSLR